MQLKEFMRWARFETGGGRVICLIFIRCSDAVGVPVAMIHVRIKVCVH